MSRTMTSYHAPDISALARSLKREIDGRAEKPGHVELLNILSRAAGFRNFQHMRASHAAGERLAAPTVVAEPIDHVRVEVALRCFDGRGTLIRWPAKTSLQQLCLWALWSRIPAERQFDEKGISNLLKDLHLFGDHALLRREMVNRRLLFRTQDCSVYRRIEQRPPPEALALLKGLNGRKTSG